MSNPQDHQHLFKSAKNATLTCSVGDSQTGKSALSARYISGNFNSDSKPTIGVEFAIKASVLNGETIKEQLWDTAGQTRYKAITSAYYRNAAGVILVYAVNDRASFDHIEVWLNELKEHVAKTIPMMLIGNKAEEGVQRQVTMPEASAFAKKHGLILMETSAKDSQSGVDYCFRRLRNEIYQQLGKTVEGNISARDFVQVAELTNKKIGGIVMWKNMLIVVSRNEHCLYQVNPNTGEAKVWAGQLNTPGQADGPLQVAQFHTPFDLTHDKFHQRLILRDAGNHRFVQISAEGEASTLCMLEDPLGSLVDDKTGIIYLSNKKQVFRFDPTTKTLTPLSDVGQIGRPLRMAIALDNTLIVADYDRHCLWRLIDSHVYQIAGSPRGEHGYLDGFDSGLLYHPSDIFVGPDGTMLIADTDNNRIRFLISGGVLDTIRREDGSAALFATPYRFCVHGSRVYVAENGNGKITAFTINSFNYSSTRIDLSEGVIDPIDGEESMLLYNSQCSKKINASFLKLRAPVLAKDPTIPPWVDQPLLDALVSYLASDNLSSCTEQMIVRLGALGTALQLHRLSSKALHALNSRVGELRMDANRTGALVFDLVALDGLFLQTTFGKFLRDLFVYSYHSSSFTYRPSMETINNHLGKLEPTLEAELSENVNAAARPDVAVEETSENEFMLGDVLNTLYDQRNETGDFTITTSVASLADSGAATATSAIAEKSTAYKCHSFVLRALWPYFRHTTRVSMREARNHELRLSPELGDGGLTAQAVEAICDLFYRGRLHPDTKAKLRPLDLICIMINKDLYGFDGLERLGPLGSLAVNINIDLDNCVEYLQLGTELGLVDLARRAQEFIVKNFAVIWSMEANREQIESLPTKAFRRLFCSAMAVLLPAAE